jgi:enterochelin esterase family protein
MAGIVPYVEEHFRVRAVPASRAIAGLSMGGGQTMHVLEEHADSFGYVSIWSAGLFRQPPPDYIAANNEFLANPQRVNDNVVLLSIVVGDDDFALPGAQALAKVYADHGIEHEFELTGGGHTWRNWRAYLRALAPRLFREARID